MFKQVFTYWNNIKDAPSIMAKINLWSFVNIRVFRFKFSRVLYFFILACEQAKIKSFKVLFKDWIFEEYYYVLMRYFLFFAVVVMVI